MADENVPSWLTVGADDNPGVTPMASTTPSQEPNSFSATTSSPPQESLEIDQGGADSRGTENSNAGRSMLKSSGAAKAKKAAPKKEVDESDLPQRLLVMRIANMLAVGALMAVSIVEMVALPPPSLWILSIYATCGGTLVCCLETQLKFVRTRIAMNFGFLFSPFWRFFFYLLMASVAWSYNKFYTKGVAIALICVAFYNTYILYRYPSYRAVREQIAEEEDRRLEAKISEAATNQVKKQAMSQMFGNK